MNDGPQPDRIDPELLAAFADGELDHAARRRVLVWLERDPDALSELIDQEGLSPNNRDYWRQVAPPLPSATQWDETLAKVARSLPAALPTRSRRGRFSRLVPIFIGVAASLLLMVGIVQLGRNAQQRDEGVAPTEVADRGAAPSDTDEDLIISVATDDDVTLIRLPESAASLVVVGRHPIEDNPLLLASAGDVELLNYSAQEPSGWPSVENSQGSETSMLWAPSRP